MTLKLLLQELRHDNEGSSLVELAMVLPLMLLILVGTLDMGSMFVRKMELANAAKAGVQYAMVRKPLQGDVTNITSAARTSLGDGLTDRTQVTTELYCICLGAKQICTIDCSDPDVSAFVTVSIREDYLTPYFNYDWFKSSFPITETATIQLN